MPKERITSLSSSKNPNFDFDTSNLNFATRKWAATWQNQQSGCAPSEDSDQPGHPPSLIRVFAVRMKKAWVLSYPLSAQRRLWSDWADAQADLILRWAHTHFVCWFCHVVAQMRFGYPCCLFTLHMLISIHFSLPLGVRDWLWLLIVALTGLFC